jgi:16S rRNA (guanine527-N7)-methyltransferase
VTSPEFQRRLAERSEATGLHVTPSLADRLDAYYQLLSTWNRRINLTALDLDSLPPDAVDRLLIEPLAAAQFAKEEVAVLDVGSGGGSPAIPFALATNACELTMIESRSRKSTFLREAAHVVGLPAVRVLNSRFEEVSRSVELKKRFEIVTIRAVRVADEDWTRFADVLTAGGSIFLLHQLGLEHKAPAGFSKLGTHRLTDKAELSVFGRQ